jgi:AcrR family transcriptional regulator
MARTRNASAHAVRRDEILDVAERLIRTLGYDAMSIQSVQDELDCSRGAIYHYFGSKEAILEAVIDRMTEVGMAFIRPIADDATLNALEKLQGVFTAGGNWKHTRKDFILPLLRVWYQPGNDLVRGRAEAKAYQQFRPLIAQVLRQGVAEGSMHVSSADDAAIIVTALFAGSTDELRRRLMAAFDGEISIEEISHFIHAYDEAIERILGLPEGSFTILAPDLIQLWFA